MVNMQMNVVMCLAGVVEVTMHDNSVSVYAPLAFSLQFVLLCVCYNETPSLGVDTVFTAYTSTYSQHLSQPHKSDRLNQTDI